MSHYRQFLRVPNYFSIQTGSQDMIEVEETLPVVISGSIFDVGAYAPNSGAKYTITLGYYSGNTAKVYQAVNKSDVEELNTISEQTHLLPKPHFAYNAQAEEEMLPVQIDDDIFEHYKELCEEESNRGDRWCPKHKWVESQSIENLHTGDGWLSETEWKSILKQPTVENEPCPKCKLDMASIVVLTESVGLDDEFLANRRNANLPETGWDGKKPKWPKLRELIPDPRFGYFHRNPGRSEESVRKMWEFAVDNEVKLRKPQSIARHNMYDLFKSAALLMWIYAEEIEEMQLFIRN